jgi:hypothetical protein
VTSAKSKLALCVSVVLIGAGAAGFVVTRSSEATISKTHRLLDPTVVRKFYLLDKTATRRRNRALRERHITAAGSPIDPLTLTALRDRALLVAATSNETHPSDGRVFQTTANAVNAVNAVDSGAGDGSNQPVYYVLMHGDFVCDVCPVPPGSPDPWGHVTSLVFEASNLRVAAVGLLGSEPAGLERLGPSTSLGF